MAPAGWSAAARRRPRSPWWWVPGAATVAVIGGVMAVTLWQLHLNLLFTNTTTTGGDTGAHIALPAYLQTLLSHGHISGWDPGWYDGFPLYTFYFALPDLFAAIGGWVIPFNIAFKLVTVLGSLLLPVTVWACGRLFRLPRPVPTVLAAFTLPFLFDTTFTIYGGNLFSTLAGEYAYSFSLALAVLFLGLFARVVRQGKGRGWASVVLAACVLSHIVPAMYALAGAAVLTGIELLPTRWSFGTERVGPWGSDLGEVPIVAVARRRRMWWATSTVGAGLLLSGWWLVPFGLRQPYATSMGYLNVTHYASLLFPEADAWALVLTGLSLVAVAVTKSRFGGTVTLLGLLSALALVFDPQGSLYNVRLLPLWLLSVYLMAGWGVGVACVALAGWWRSTRSSLWERVSAGDAEQGPPPHRPWEGRRSVARWSTDTATSWAQRLTPQRSPTYQWAPAALGGAVVGLLVCLAVVIPPFFVPANDLPVTLGANQVTNWSDYNYLGYQGQPDYPEYKALVATMSRLGKQDGCGRAMWEYSDNEDRFGTPESLMLLPYWTGGCIASMEGLLFESSATTPYHFIDQSELSKAPSDPEANLPYGPLDVQLGVQHLQLLGVKYFMAETPPVEQEAAADPALRLVATTGPWETDYNGATLRTTWHIYEVQDSALVVPLRNKPAVVQGISAGTWLSPSLAWYTHPGHWGVELAQSGPADWPRVQRGTTSPPASRVPATKVSDVTTGDDDISFTVSRIGIPVLVKVSYFPNWQASGASGPFRVTPNLMVVVPTSRHVELTYGATTVNDLGYLATAGGVVLLVSFGIARRKSRARASTTT